MIPAFESEPYREKLDVEVTRVSEDDIGRYALLDNTILYPEGGGQPADRGGLNTVRVLDVRRVDGEIRHYLENAIGLGPATLTLEWQRRFDHMQQHTAQHLLSAIAANELGWETTSFHIGSRSSDIELDVSAIAATDLDLLETRAATVIHEARRVSARRAAAEDLAGSDFRSRGLPRGHEGAVRLVEIDGIDCSACGGTHVGTTAEIGTVKLLGTESMRGGTRLHWVAGERVRILLAAHEGRAAELRALFETSDEELLQAACSKLGRLKQAEREIKELRSELAAEAAQRLESSEGPVIDAHFDGADAGFLQSVARRMIRSGTSRAGLLTASRDAASFFVVYLEADSGEDLATIGTRIAALLDGRGGGSAGLFQGEAGSLDRREQVIALLAEAMEHGSR